MNPDPLLWALVALAVVVLSLVVYVSFKERAKPTPAPDEIPNVQTHMAPTAATEGGVPEWPDRATLIAAVSALYLLSLLVVGLVARGALYRPIEAPFDHAVEILLLAGVVCWIAFSIADSLDHFLKHFLKFAAILSVMLLLVISQHRVAFWLAFLTVIVIGLHEIRIHINHKEKLKTSARLLFILLAWLTMLHLLASYFLAMPQDLFATLLDVATKLRILFLVMLSFVVILAAVISTLQQVSWHSNEYFNLPHGSTISELLLQPIIRSINVVLNVLSNVSYFFAMVLVDVWRFLRDVFLDRNLWRTVLNVAFIAFWSFIIGLIIASLKAPLSVVLRRPSAIFSIDSSVLLANAMLIGIVVAGLISVLALTLTWISRSPPEYKSAAAQRVISGAVVIYICSWLATLTYYYPVNQIFGLHPDLYWPGLFTSLAVPFAIAGCIKEFRRSKRERGEPEDMAIPSNLHVAEAERTGE